MKTLYQTAMIFLMMSVATGIVYPLAVHSLAQIIFSHQANGSLVTKDGVIVGSELIAQQFDNDKYFWPRPSAGNWQTLPSSASNLGPTSLALKNLIEQRRHIFAHGHDVDENEIPVDMITASASGLDPHISWASAELQVKRIARARGFTKDLESKVFDLIESLAQERRLAKFDEKMLNVLLLNVNLDKISHHDRQ